METLMKYLQRPVTTLKESQRLGRWDRLEVYLSDRERPWKTASDPVVLFVSYGNKTKYLWRPPTTLKDHQRLAVSKFGAKSSNLNEDFERPLTSMKNCQRPWKTANGWQWSLRKTVNDNQRPVTTISKPGLTRVHVLSCTSCLKSAWHTSNKNTFFCYNLP